LEKFITKNQDFELLPLYLDSVSADLQNWPNDIKLECPKYFLHGQKAKE